MERFISHDLELYCVKHSNPEGEVFRLLRDVTEAKTDLPQMQVGPLEGAFLRMLVHLTGAVKVIEIGTFTGYSALAMAEALPAPGMLYACDTSEEWTQIARDYWNKSPHGDKIDLHIRPGLDTINMLLKDDQGETFDMAFIDADKANYVNYYEGCLQLLKSGGLLVVDNALWSGRVTAPEDQHDERTAAIHALNHRAAHDDRVETVLLPVRDGMHLIRKL